jgi:GPH family glycoside/pentoside/hexuronide:cation symporter
MMFAISCGLGLAAASLPLVSAFGGGHQGFFRLSLLYAAFAAIILLVCFRSTREAVADPAETHPSLAQMVRAVRTNTPFLLLLGATMLGSIGYTMSGKALLYYMKYHAGSEAAMTTGLTVSLAAAAVAMVPWMMLTKRTSRRAAWSG